MCEKQLENRNFVLCIVIKKNKTPRRKSMARSKVFDGKTANDWNVVVNKRKILRIKRQRAGIVNH